MAEYALQATQGPQEFSEAMKVLGRARQLASQLLNKRPEEVALLGPTSLGLSLFAQGLEWQKGDEVIVYFEDYPANVYPWLELRRKGVVVKFVPSAVLGRIQLEDVLNCCTERTRLVALASCHYLTGWRLDISTLVKELKERNILFSLDAIQTLGAFATPCEGVDFVSADSHKWLLGPMAAGIVAVSEKIFGLCRPILVGAWNVRSPDFLAMEEVEFEPTARRYEPGALNFVGVWGMVAAMELLRRYGAEQIERQILCVRDYLEEGLERLGWQFLSPRRWEPMRSGILTACPPDGEVKRVFGKLHDAGVVVSLRKERSGKAWIRFSPHFYNTLEEMELVLKILRK